MRWVDSYPEAIEKRDDDARPVLERIERDRAGAGSEVAPIPPRAALRLGAQRHALEARVWDSRQLGSDRVPRCMGRPLRAYIEARRLEVAEVMLRESRLRVWQIAELVGYTRAQAFCRAFERCYADRPRHIARKAGSTVGELGVRGLS
jgi:hypothetical protein